MITIMIMDIPTRGVITNSREDTDTAIAMVKKRKRVTVTVVVMVMAVVTDTDMVVMMATVMDILMVKRNSVVEGDIVMAPRVL